MQPLAPLHLNSHCMAALFVADVPFFALADGTLHRWDGGPKVTSTHNGLLAATPTGDRSAILTAGEDGRVCRTGKCGTSVELARVPRKWITTVASGYAGAFAFGSGRTVWLHEGAGAMRVLQHPSAVEDIAFAPDGSRIAVARYNGVSIHSLGGDSAPIELPWKSMNTSVTFSPTGAFCWQPCERAGFMAGVCRMASTCAWSDMPPASRIGHGVRTANGWRPLAHWSRLFGPSKIAMAPWAAPLELGAREASFVTAVACHPARRMVAIGYAYGLIRRPRSTPNVRPSFGPAAAAKLPRWHGTSLARASPSARSTASAASSMHPYERQRERTCKYGYGPRPRDHRCTVARRRCRLHPRGAGCRYPGRRQASGHGHAQSSDAGGRRGVPRASGHRWRRTTTAPAALVRHGRYPARQSDWHNSRIRWAGS